MFKFQRTKNCGFLVKCAKKVHFFWVHSQLSCRNNFFRDFRADKLRFFMEERFFRVLYFNSWETLHIQVGWKIQTFRLYFSKICWWRWAFVEHFFPICRKNNYILYFFRNLKKICCICIGIAHSTHALKWAKNSLRVMCVNMCVCIWVCHFYCEFFLFELQRFNLEFTKNTSVGKYVCGVVEVELLMVMAMDRCQFFCV